MSDGDKPTMQITAQINGEPFVVKFSESDQREAMLIFLARITQALDLYGEARVTEAAISEVAPIEAR